MNENLNENYINHDGEGMKLFDKINLTIVLSDLKITTRQQRLLLIIIVFGSIVFSYAYSLLLPGIHIVFFSFGYILFGLEPLFANIFLQNKNELYFYSTLPIAYRNLIFIKNANSFLITLSCAIISMGILLVSGKVKMAGLLAPALFLIQSIIAALISGNFMSLFSKKRQQQKFLYLFMLVHSIAMGVSGAVFYSTYMVLDSFILYCCFLLIEVLLYLVSVYQSAKLLMKYKYELLEA